MQKNKTIIAHIYDVVYISYGIQNRAKMWMEWSDLCEPTQTHTHSLHMMYVWWLTTLHVFPSSIIHTVVVTILPFAIIIIAVTVIVVIVATVYLVKHKPCRPNNFHWHTNGETATFSLRLTFISFQQNAPQFDCSVGLASKLRHQKKEQFKIKDNIWLKVKEFNVFEIMKTRMKSVWRRCEHFSTVKSITVPFEINETMDENKSEKIHFSLNGFITFDWFANLTHTQ